MKGRCRKGWMLEGANAGKGGCRKGQMLKGRMLERANAGKGRCRKGADARSNSKGSTVSPDSMGDLRRENCLAEVHTFFTKCFRAPTIRRILDMRYV
jgi:hypothetical protein